MDDLLADDNALRVYADQLLDRGDPWGELIVVATERCVRDTPELARREAELTLAQERRLDEVLTRDLRQRYRWRLGFVDAIELDWAGDEPFAILPRLAAEPAMRRLRRIQIEAIEMDGRGRLEPIVAELAALAPRFPRLVELALVQGADFGNPWIDGPLPIGDLTPLYAAYPALEVLELGGRDAQLGDLALPSLQAFRASHLHVEHVRAIIAARWPRIRSLGLAFADRRVDNVAARFGPLLHRDFGPGLIDVELSPPAAAVGYVVDELPDSPLARHARSLAMYTALDTACVDRVIAQAGVLRRLERLALSSRGLTASQQKRLVTAFGRALVLR